MVRYSSFVIPRIDEFPYLEKPPLSYWLAWLSCQAAGKLTAACIRLPSALFGVMSLGLLYWIARRRNGTAVACVTVLFAATSIELYQFHQPAFFVLAPLIALAFAYWCRRVWGEW